MGEHLRGGMLWAVRVDHLDKELRMEEIGILNKVLNDLIQMSSS